MFKAIQQSNRWQDIGHEIDNSEPGTWYGDHVRNLATAKEWWARAYAQWVALRSGSMRLTDELDRGLHHDAPGVRLKFWGGTDFLSIAVALDSDGEHGMPKTKTDRHRLLGETS